jgi:hypothetical protein
VGELEKRQLPSPLLQSFFTVLDHRYSVNVFREFPHMYYVYITNQFQTTFAHGGGGGGVKVEEVTVNRKE